MTHRTVREVMTDDVMTGARSADTTREAATGWVRPGGGTILDAIGNTPLIMVGGIWVKLEYLNPSGSIKAHRQVHDRAGGAGTAAGAA